MFLSDVSTSVKNPRFLGAPIARSQVIVMCLARTSWFALQNGLYRLSSVRNDLQIAEFFEPIFAEPIPIPESLYTAEWMLG